VSGVSDRSGTIGSAKVNTVRVIQDGDFVFAHTDYDFFGPKIGFDMFRIEKGKIAEHLNTIESIPEKQESGKDGVLALLLPVDRISFAPIAGVGRRWPARPQFPLTF